MLKLDKLFGNKNVEEITFPNEKVINCEVFNIEVLFIKKKNSSVMIKDDTLIFRLSSYLRKHQIKNHFWELS